jgi:hypothetical protein
MNERRFLTYIWFAVIAFILAVECYFVLTSGRIVTCVMGVLMALTLFMIRSRFLAIYGVTEVVAGIAVLASNYSVGRGGFSSGFFAEAVEGSHWNVILITTLGAVYIMVRGIDNCVKGMRKGA